MKKIAFVFMTLALVTASAKTYSLRVFEPIVLSGTAIQPGECRLTVEGDEMTVKCGKVNVTSKVRIENLDKKSSSTSFIYEPQGGKNVVKEIRVGGTDLKVVVN